MKSPALKLLPLAIALCASAPAPRAQTLPRPADAPAAAARRDDVATPRAEAWLRVRSKNFHVVGHAGEAELRALAARLEEFRAVFWQVLGEDYFDSRVPAVFVVFRDEGEYGPFKPLRRDGLPASDVAGYFQPGPEVNYITLSAGGARGEALTALAFHEYVHLLYRNRFRRVPLWLGEGLSEYYNSFALADGGRRVRLGPALGRRAAHLRAARGMLPLAALLAVDHASPHYNDHDKRGIFYAQSWALTHFLLSDPSAERRRGIVEYLELVAAGESSAESFERAFGIDLASAEAGLREYVRAGRYGERSKLLGAPPTFDPTSTAETLGEADVRAAFGDVLLRAERHEAAEEHLRAALALAPRHAPALASLGILHLRENRLDEAREHLSRALAADPRNHLARYHFAELLLRSGPEADSTVAGYAEKTRLVRAELERAIEIAPDFLEAYALLARVDLERSPRLGEAASLVRRAQLIAPRRREFALLAARIQLRAEEFAAARATLQTLLDERTLAPALRAEARAALDEIAGREADAARRRERADGTLAATAPLAPLQPCDMPEPGPHLKPLRFAGEQFCGRLTRIDCDDEGAVVLTVSAGERTLRLHSVALNRIRFVTYTRDVRGRVECGPRSENVLVTYRPAPDGGTAATTDGVVTAVEFLPDGQNH